MSPTPPPTPSTPRPEQTSGSRALTASNRKKLARGIAALIVIVLVFVGVWVFNLVTNPHPGGQGSQTVSTSQGSKASSHGSTSTTNGSAGAKAPANPSSLSTVKASALPAEAQRTLALIAKGGPYPYDRDGINFGNFEGVLPKKPGGYYSEYTVDTPGSSDRGARRIIVGKGGEKYYTDDHYATFRFIEEDQ
ncbi:ribonuclease [Psychromicrobium xiongbiense]|uniref:ribonuclease n=1 Tax=Psychromicrobium xiongbiense TaxID=3051184 RepID=UPI0025549FC5|nr:ribonuclease [Psychromicrobium sp. YIM S02556]